MLLLEQDEDLTDAFSKLCIAMRRKARFLRNATHRIRRVKLFVKRLPKWRKRVMIRGQVTGLMMWNKVKAWVKRTQSNACVQLAGAEQLVGKTARNDSAV